MTAYESRAAAAEDLKIDIVEMQMNGKGYCYDGCIFIRSDLSDAEKKLYPCGGNRPLLIYSRRYYKSK